MHSISFEVVPDPNRTGGRETWSLKFKVDYPSDEYKAFVQKYFEEKNDTTQVIVTQSFFQQAF